MGRAEGSVGDQLLAVIEQAQDRVDLGGLQSLLKVQGRQDRGKPLGQHGFARPGRAAHEDVVPPGRSHHQGPLGRLLALDLGHLRDCFSRLGLVQKGLGAFEFAIIVEESDHLWQRLGHFDRQPLNHRPLGAVLWRKNDAVKAALPGCQGQRQGAVDRFYQAIQGKFPSQQPTAQTLRAQPALGGQQPHSDGQVEAGAFLAHASRRQVDGDPIMGEGKAGILDGRPDTVLGLLDRRVR